jgi:benzoyl-CoA reductase/2-hydroxyglutaryl-CoA dehydratase subunit BcrC/BadD/HgdB
MGISTFRNIGTITEDHLRNIEKQIKGLIPELEEISGNTFDIDKFRHVLSLSYDCTLLWKKVLETNMAKPAPISFFDETIHMGPAVVLRGTETAVEYYKVLLKELEERVANKDGAVEDEKFRIYWEGMPIWGCPSGENCGAWQNFSSSSRQL